MEESDRLIGDFFGFITKVYGKIVNSQSENMKSCAKLIADCIAEEDKGRTYHVWGPGGHSSIIAEETLYRKGGFASVDPILDSGISLSHGAFKEINNLERLAGYGTVILDYNNVKEGDVLLLGSAYGINMVAIEAALEAKRRGVKVIALTSPAFSKGIAPESPARHPSKKNLYEIADLYIDLFLEEDDPVLQVDGFDHKVSPVGTILVSSVYQCLVGLIASELVQRGIKPKIWVNALTVTGVAENQAYIEDYYCKYKSL
jgi:uncharacterized phosphosugar-binding protein